VTLTEILGSKFSGPALKPAERWVKVFFHLHGKSTVAQVEEESLSLRRYAAGTVRNATWRLVELGVLRRVDAGGPGVEAILEEVNNADA
jgi:hypothetical protein